MKPTFATKVTLVTVCKWVSPQYTIDCFTDVSTREACTVTPSISLSQKLGLDKMFERSIRTLKSTNMIKLPFYRTVWVYSLRVTVWMILMIIVT